MPIKTITAALLFLAACTEDVEMNPLPEVRATCQDSDVCDVRKYLCDPYDPEANGRCDTVCGGPGHCLDYNSVELRLCERHPAQWINGGYCNPLGEPTWPTHCVDGWVP